MPRYIDADALRKEHCEYCNAIKDDPNCDICATMQWVNETPTADVVEVVRCKDCRYRTDYGKSEQALWFCDANEHWCRDDDFCSSGERRNDAEIH